MSFPEIQNNPQGGGVLFLARLIEKRWKKTPPPWGLFRETPVSVPFDGRDRVNSHGLVEKVDIVDANPPPATPVSMQVSFPIYIYIYI